MSGYSVVFYGERGLVSGLVLELKDNLHLTRKLLSAVNYCGGRAPQWTGQVEEASFLLEPSFSEFGNPDLVITCKCADGSKHAVFMEAKTVPYADCAVPLRGREVVPGINSRINAQLTLRYRLAEALKERKKGRPVEEKHSCFAPYKSLLTDTGGRPRRVLNRNVIGLCDSYLHDVDQYWFVALTADSSKAAPFENEELRPVVFDANGNDAWHSVSGRFGLLTFGVVDEIMPPEGLYASAQNHFPLKSFPVKYNGEAAVLQTSSWDNFSQPVREGLRRSMQELVEDALDSVLGAGSGYRARTEHNGSDSYIVGRRTLLKLIPKRNEAEGMMLAVSAGLFTAAGLADDYFPEGPYLVGAGGRRRAFSGITFHEEPKGRKRDEYIYVLEEYCRAALEQL